MTDYYWHFAQVDEHDTPRLGYDDRREIRVGETLAVHAKPVLCHTGLHASAKLWDALGYVRGNRLALCRVTLGGTVLHDDDKSVANERTVVAMLDADTTDKLLRDFARWCALQVIHLWDAPDVVRRYLETGDESLRSVAWDAARDAAWDAAMSAAMSAARDAAWDAARSAAWSAAWSAAMSAAAGAAAGAAWSAAMSTARSAARSAATSAAMSAAWSAAMSAAAGAAAGAAWSTARDAARSAAWSAAMSTAWSAAMSAATSAAMSAATSAAMSAATSAAVEQYAAELERRALEAMGK